MKKKVQISTAFPQKQNGNMLPEQVQLHGIPLGMMNRNLVNMHGILKTLVQDHLKRAIFLVIMKMIGLKISGTVKPIRLARKGQTRGDCTTFMGIYGNGYRMNGIIPMTALQLMAVLGKMEMALTG